MTTAQCITGAVWAACAIDVYTTLGAPGVTLFVAVSGVLGALIYRKLFKKENHHDA